MARTVDRRRKVRTRGLTAESHVTLKSFEKVMVRRLTKETEKVVGKGRDLFLPDAFVVEDWIEAAKKHRPKGSKLREDLDSRRLKLLIPLAEEYVREFEFGAASQYRDFLKASIEESAKITAFYAIPEGLAGHAGRRKQGKVFPPRELWQNARQLNKDSRGVWLGRKKEQSEVINVHKISPMKDRVVEWTITPWVFCFPPSSDYYEQSWWRSRSEDPFWRGFHAKPASVSVYSGIAFSTHGDRNRGRYRP